MTGIQDSIAVLDRGGPPLLGSDVPYYAGIDPTHLTPVGFSDDQGIYLWLPLLGHWTGQKDPVTLLKWLYIGCFALLVLVFPLVFYGLFGSSVVAALSPFIALWQASFTGRGDIDIYWISFWSMLLGLPAVFVAYRTWAHRRALAALILAGAMLVGGFSTSIRIHSGVPILVGGLAVVLAAGDRWWRSEKRRWVRPTLALLLALVYFSLGTFTLDAARAYRNHAIHQSTFGSTYPTQHPFWHNAYIGLGYLPNRYGISWYDAVAIDAVERARPGTSYLSTEYEATLRHLYFRIVRHDPEFVLDNFWIKTKTIVVDASRRYFWVFLLAPFALLAGRDRRAMAWFVCIAVPAVVLGALPPMITRPQLTYELGWLGAWCAVWVVFLGWALAAALRQLAQLRRDERDVAQISTDVGNAIRAVATSRRFRRRFQFGAVVAALALSVRVFVSVGPPPDANFAYAAGQSDFALPSANAGRVTREWQFARTIPPGWTLERDAFAEADDGGTYIRTPMTRQATILTSPILLLGRGRYDVLLQGGILVGGMQVQATNAASGAPLGTSRYSALQTFGTAPMLVRVRTSRPTGVRIRIASWSPIREASAWTLQRLTVARA